MIITSAHDKIFRASLQNINVVREYIQQYYPENLLKIINLNKLESCPEIYINQYLELSESDVIYKTQISGKTGYLYLAAEHQSRSDVFMPLRLLQYNISVWRFHRDQHPKIQKLPLIINTVFYNGKTPYIHSTDFKDLFDAPRELVDQFWAKPFKLIQVRDLPDEVLLNQKWSGLFQFFMKHVYQSDFLPYLEKALPYLSNIDAENGLDYIESLVSYALSTAQISDVEKFIQTLKHKLSDTTGETIMTGAEYLIQKGMERGIKKGMHEGMQQGMQKGALEGEKIVLMKLLKSRFGGISAEYMNIINHSDSDTLLYFAEKILTAKTIDEVFNSYH